VVGARSLLQAPDLLVRPETVLGTTYDTILRENLRAIRVDQLDGSCGHLHDQCYMQLTNGASPCP
jgi:hypothetical protein